MKLRCAPQLLLLGVLSWHVSVCAQKTDATPVLSARADVNLLTQSALQLGVLNCIGRINQVGNFLGFGPQAGALFLSPGDRPDQRLLSFSMELPSEAATAYADATFAPNQANGCGAVYEALAYWPKSCEALASQNFSGFKRMGQLKEAIQVLDGGPMTKVFLMPAGSGCLSIKKEIVL